MTVIGSYKSRRRIRCMLVDLDDTLYRVEHIPKVVRQRIEEYMVTKLGISALDVVQLTTELYLNYGTTVAGLVARGYKIDLDDWHAYVHHEAIDYEHVLLPDPALRDLLFSIDIPKYILTNADKRHTEICLQQLGITDCFQGVFHFENVQELAHQHKLGTTVDAPGIMCKPNPKIYELVLDKVGAKATETIFFDDSVRNIASAHSLGIMTVLVGKEAVVPGADLALTDLHQLPRVMPELLDQPGEVHVEHEHFEHNNSVAITVPS